MTTFLIVVIGLGWLFSLYFGNPVILYGVLAFAFFQALVSYWFSDRIVLSLSGAREISRDTHRELWNITENLCMATGLTMPRLYIIQDPAPNAFATGRNQKHGIVAVTTGLLDRLDRSEIEGVIAHELAHIGNRDMLIMTMTVVLVGFITLLADVFLRATLWGGGNRREGGQVQVVLMIIGFALMILSPIIATLIRMAVSRKREYLADATAALMTRYPEGLASALEKISSYPRTMERANHATAHLFISNPFKDKKGAWSNMWSTHPPVEERIKRLRGM